MNRLERPGGDLSADPEILFKKLLKDLRPVFKENGFRWSGQNFILEAPECWVIVNFQKSRWSNKDEKTFYVNVAATAKRLLAFNNDPVDKAPPFFWCDWRWRAEQFGQDPEIKDWTIRDDSSAHEVFIYLERLLKEFVFPAITGMTTEAALLKRATVFELGYPQLKARSVLLAADGRTEELQQVIDVLMEKFGSGVVANNMRNHLASLRAKFPDQTRNLIVE